MLKPCDVSAKFRRQGSGSVASRCVLMQAAKGQVTTNSPCQYDGDVFRADVTDERESRLVLDETNRDVVLLDAWEEAAT